MSVSDVLRRILPGGRTEGRGDAGRSTPPFEETFDYLNDDDDDEPSDEDPGDVDSAYRAARPWADDLASDGGARRDRVSSLIDAVATNDDDDDAESVQSDHDRVRMEALRMLNLADDRDGGAPTARARRGPRRGRQGA